MCENHKNYQNYFFHSIWSPFALAVALRQSKTAWTVKLARMELASILPLSRILLKRPWFVTEMFAQYFRATFRGMPLYYVAFPLTPCSAKTPGVRSPALSQWHKYFLRHVLLSGDQLMVQILVRASSQINPIVLKVFGNFLVKKAQCSEIDCFRPGLLLY